MAPSSFWVSAFLALNYEFAQAKPMADDAMAVAPVATMNIQPIRILTELPISIRTHCPRPTKIVICHGKTLTVTRTGLFKTVVTLTYEEVQTHSRLNCGQRTSKVETPAIGTTSESPGSSGPITSGPVSSTESIFPASFTTSPTPHSVPESSEPGSIRGDSKTGDEYKFASNSASGPPRSESSSLDKPFQDKFTSQPSPSSRINIDTAESQSSQTPFPSATTESHGDTGQVPGASVSESGVSVVSPSDGSRRDTTVEVRTKAGSQSPGSSQTPLPSTYGDVPGSSVSESIASPSDGFRIATTVEVRTKAGPESFGSTGGIGSSRTPLPSTYSQVPGASVSESIVSPSDGFRIATTVEVRTKAGPESSGSTNRAGSSQTPLPSTYGDVPGASVSESIASPSDGFRIATTVEVRTKAGPESSGSTGGVGSSRTPLPSTYGDVLGASVSESI
ncbi:hypothetical protein E4U58_003944, partial [Claviceps cyperi]